MRPLEGVRVADLTWLRVAAFGMEEIWRDAQTLGIPWSPIRKPEENVEDEQWQVRETFNEVEHPELGETFPYIGAPMLPHEVSPCFC